MFQLTTHQAVATLRYVHPPRGFLTAASLAQLRRLMMQLERDPSVRVIVIAGQPGVFIAHTEMAEIEQMLALTARMPVWLLPLLRLWVWLARRFPRLADLGDPVQAAPLNVLLAFDALQRSRKITVAAIDGPCLGGGLELSLCCDYRLASDDASHLVACPEIRMGLIPGFGGSQRLARILGRPRALELLLDGTLLTPAQAAQAGIMSRLLPRSGFDEAVRHFATSMAQRPPLAVAALKRALADEVWDGLWIELREVIRLTRSLDLQRGMAAYRAALAETEEPAALLERMQAVPFEGA